MHHLFSLSALALSAASTASAYLDSSPFFMFSTSELLNHATTTTATTKIATADVIASEISKSLASVCPSDYYILVSQPGVTTDDYHHYFYSQSQRTTSSFLSQRLAVAKPGSSRSSNNPQIRSTLSIPDVIGAIDTKALAKHISKSCHIPQRDIDATTGSIPASYSNHDDNSLPRGVVTVQLAAPSGSTPREHDFSLNDALLAWLLDVIPSSNYTIIYTTSPTATPATSPAREEQTEEEDDKQYEMDPTDIQESLHLDLKRAVGSVAATTKPGSDKQQATNTTLVDGPLFHRYQFFTPGIFMGFLVGFLLLVLLYVAVSALSSLQVTYAAFDKEQGQLAAKKLQ